MDLFLICNGFPYGPGDSFLKTELPYLSAGFKSVTIFNLVYTPGETITEIPANVKVINQASIKISTSRSLALRRNFCFVLKSLRAEFADCSNKIFFLKSIRSVVSELLNSIILAEKISTLQWNKDQTVFYSFWMNSGALAQSVLKYNGRIKYSVFRVHNFDLYKERHPGNYLAFRKTNYHYNDRVFVISQLGKKYIEANYDNSEKASVSYLGTNFHGSNPFDKNTFTIVSCSNITAIKRVSLICEALTSIKDMQVNWFHFGDGVLKKELQDSAKALPANIRFTAMGHVSPDQLFEFYRTTPVSLFINVSKMEGIPVSIMEAASFGIPVMGTDVGGTSEIVTAETGILLNKDITKENLSAAIRDFFAGELNTSEFRRNVAGFWQKHFSSEANYTAFCNDLYSLTK